MSVSDFGTVYGFSYMFIASHVLVFLSVLIVLLPYYLSSFWCE